MKTIENKQQYDAVMDCIEELLKESEDNIPSMKELEELSIMASDYEDTHYPIGHVR